MQSEIGNPKSEMDSVACPFCNSTDTEMIALFGMQLMTSQYYCRNCHSAFEGVKWNKTTEGTSDAEEKN